jgi:2-hydroxycyclohexanecarboxyl-CoA dehydrogenase
MPHQRTVLITGANSDIGAEICRKYLDEGCKVIAIIHCSNSNIKQYLDKGIKIIDIDFSDKSSVENFIISSKILLEKVDIFISLASVRNPIQYGEINSENLLEHFTVNVVPVVLLTQFFGNSMSVKGWGRIVIGSSIGVKFGGGVDTYCYSISKYASELIPRIAKEWSKNGVIINVARIGVTDTKAFRKIGNRLVEKRSKLIPMHRLASKEEICKSIYWLASEENTYITNQVIAISGGE